MALTIAQVEDTDAGWSEIDESWRALDARRPVRVPFTDPAWCRLWWRHHRRDTLRARDDLRLFTLSDGADLVAVAPMMLTRRPGRLPFSTRELQFLGADPNLTELRGMLAAPGWEGRAALALAGHLAARSEWDWVQWHGLPAEGPLPPGVVATHAIDDFLLPLASDWPAFRQALPRNIKESLRKCYNSLARDGHGWTLHVHEGPGAVAALPTLIALHRLRARQTGMTAHVDVFADRHAPAFLADYVRQAPSARLFSLEIGGQVVAMRLGFAYLDELYLYYSGFDPAWAPYSVMTTVLSEALRWAIGQGLSRVNLSTGADVSKLRWRPVAVRTRSGTQVGKGRRGRVAHTVVTTLRHAVPA